MVEILDLMHKLVVQVFHGTYFQVDILGALADLVVVQYLEIHS